MKDRKIQPYSDAENRDALHNLVNNRLVSIRAELQESRSALEKGALDHSGDGSAIGPGALQHLITQLLDANEELMQINQELGEDSRVHIAGEVERERMEEERDRLVKELEAERYLWQATVENMLDPVTTCDANGRANFMNSAYKRLLKRDIKPGLGLENHPEYYRIYHPDGKPFESRDLPLQKSALTNQEVHNVEIIQYGSNDEKYHMVWNAAPLHGAEGELLGAVAVGRDITIQRQAEEATRRLIEENQRHRELLEKIFEIDPGGVAVVTGENFIFQIVNPAYQALTPHPEIDPVGKPYQEVWSSVEGFHGLPILKRVMENGEGESLDHAKRIFPDGTERFFSIHTYPLEWEDEPAFLLVLWETTAIEVARNQARQAAAEARRKAREAEEGRRTLEALMAYIPEGITIAEARDGKPDIHMVSVYGSQLIGYTPDRILGRPREDWWKLYHIDNRMSASLDELPLSRTIRDGEVIKEEEWFLQDARGEFVPIMCNAGPIRNQDGEIIGGILAWRDIAEHKRMEGQLERSNRDLQDFAYIASHDLQEPLRKIQAFGDRLNNQYKDVLGDQGRDYLERMQSAAERMQTMINDLLAYSRVTTKPSPFSTVNLNILIQDVLEDIETRIESTNGKVEVGSLPSIQADPLQMRQLMQNLIVNGLKFHKEGVAPVVRIHAMESDRGLVTSGQGIENSDQRLATGDQENMIDDRRTRENEVRAATIFVEDNGIGFDQKYERRLFQPFHRLVNRSEYEGSGIGLAICRKIVERHKGTISVKSKAGEGTTFVIRLPVQQEH